ncbi:MAG: YraN family protein [Phycisphaerales bacterium]|nr:YraN family protein [Phycisphaerales bacterium]
MQWKKNSTPAARLGRRGERLAAKHLRRHVGIKILARNVRCPGGEIDLIGLHHEDLVFIEVRTRSSEDFGPPELTIGHNKQRFLRRSARWFIARRRLERLTPRFDVVAIVWPPGQRPVVRHHVSVFAIRN